MGKRLSGVSVVARNIARIRYILGETQEAFARRFNDESQGDLSSDGRMVRKWERGDAMPSSPKLYNFVRSLERDNIRVVSIGDVFGNGDISDGNLLYWRSLWINLTVVTDQIAHTKLTTQNV